VLTIQEMTTTIAALTLLLASRKDSPASERELIWETRHMIDAARERAMTNEYAGDYDYPESEEGEA
jgi:hypothetical protein